MMTMAKAIKAARVSEDGTGILLAMTAFALR